MFKRNLIWVVGAAILAIGCSSGSNEPSSSTTAGSTTTGTTTSGTTGSSNASADAFASVQPIFNQNCVGCHGADHPKGGINLTSAETINKGGTDGPIVTAGDPDKSKLVDALRGRNGVMQMPKGKAPLAEDDIKKIEAWIKAGAKS
ncbi:MAG TPA: c-type cytochrome domain-containing protein [Fimbriimonadaceae bacterium]|nr:c-type cytochrome domain-containing protein [Fimbriimonadaceae bacterium]